MPQADTAGSTVASRRHFLALASSTPASAILERRAANASADATLLLLGRRLDELWAVERAAFDDPEMPREDALVTMRATQAVVAQFVDIPATTLAGLRIKARAASWRYGGMEGLLEEHEGEAADERLVENIIVDILRMEQGR